MQLEEPLVTENPAEALRLARLIEERVAHLLGQQEHCAHFLTPIADPRGKSVLVVGAGAGTELLWARQQGATEVVGLDLFPQPKDALERAAAILGVDAQFEVREMSIDDAEVLGRRFDLVLSNNVFEHLQNLERAFEVCSRLVKPNTGRIAIFTNPLFYSSTGSHLEHHPWEHLWGDRKSLDAELREKGRFYRGGTLATSSDDFFDQIGLNRMDFGRFFAAIRRANLVVLSLGVMRDRHLDVLPTYLETLREYCFLHGISTTDLAIEGIYVELAALAPGEALPLRPSIESRERPPSEQERSHTLERQVLELRDAIAQLEASSKAHQDALHAILRSRRYRLGDALSRPWRWLSQFWR